MWGNAIWEGYKQYREAAFKISPGILGQKRKTPGQDSAITLAQISHYELSVKRIRELHRKGWLLCRCADPAEAHAIAGHRPSMAEGTTFSTTLLPKENSILTMWLFMQNQPGFLYPSTIRNLPGFLLDPSRVSSEDFGLAFCSDAGTGRHHFSKEKKMSMNGAISLEAQHNLLKVLENLAREGKSISGIVPELNEDRTQWKISSLKTLNSLGKGTFDITYNEISYYRGIGGDLLIGLFIDSESLSFEEDLTRLLTTQDHIRRTKGRFLPIFSLDHKKNQLHELPPKW